jgi:hypothetical protein
VNVIVLSRFPDIFEKCRQGLERFASKANNILVRDGDEIPSLAGWTAIQGIEPFVYARNANLGIKACDGDFVLMNDDIELKTAEALPMLERTLAEHPQAGIIAGGEADGYKAAPWVAFGCPIIRRAMYDAIGPLDEGFIGYGWEDVDYCRRAKAAGWEVGLVGGVGLSHPWTSSSFHRRSDRGKLDGLSEAHYLEKWGSLKYAAG